MVKVKFYFLSEKCTFLTPVGKNVLFVLLSEKLQSEKRLSIIWSSEKLLSEKSRGARQCSVYLTRNRRNLLQNDDIRILNNNLIPLKEGNKVQRLVVNLYYVLKLA